MEYIVYGERRMENGNGSFYQRPLKQKTRNASHRVSLRTEVINHFSSIHGVPELNVKRVPGETTNHIRTGKNKKKTCLLVK